MGIFRYFYWHFHTYPDSVTYIDAPQKVEGFHILGLDLNAIFHPVCQDYFFDKKLSVSSKKSTRGCYEAICTEIERIILLAPPSEELILSIDGVAGLSKMNQQRQRRFRSAKEKTEDMRRVFDSNQISTGTMFLTELSQFITAHFTREKRQYKVIIQDETMMGEGEHKIIRYLEQKKKKRVCIYSPDADLIMLGIGLHKKNIFILRPNIYSNVKCSHFMVSLDIFRKQVIQMVDPQRHYPEREEQIVDDFVFLLYFLGNDFLPHSPSFEIKYKGIDKILEIYSTIFRMGLRIVRTKPFSISTKGFQMMTHALAGVEVQMIMDKQKAFRGFPNRLLDKYGKSVESRFDSYRNEYYNLHFPGVERNDICRDYVIGLLFVGTYYYQGMPDWLYHYPYYHGPFFHELYEYSMQLTTDWIYVEFESHEPLLPLEQLMCVLPPESKQWLPSALQIYYEKDSELIDIYPSEFTIDLDGVQNEYEGLVILPPIPLDRIKRAFKKVEKRLTVTERKRNHHQ
jgi:5'-3' exonuclease